MREFNAHARACGYVEKVDDIAFKNNKGGVMRFIGRTAMGTKIFRSESREDKTGEYSTLL